MKTTEKLNRLAPCGLHCGICTMYRVYHDKNLDLWEETPRNFRELLRLGDESENSPADYKDLACEGCRSSEVLGYCAECDIRKCVLEEKGLEWCYQCESFPCQMLRDYGSYWRMPIVENLREIQKIGPDRWLEQEEEKWSCPKCDTRLHWFSFCKCPKCGESLPDPGQKKIKHG